jgi:hypothetical protein
VREISASSIEIAESYIIQLLRQYLNLGTVPEKVFYLHRIPSQRNLKLHISDYNFSISLIRSTVT